MDFPTRTVHLPNLGNGLDFEVLAHDAIIGPAIEKGSWADDETGLMVAQLATGRFADGRSSARVVDLGANVGWFAVQAVLAGAEVDAFEPVPGIAAVARRNVEAAMACPGAGVGRVHEVAAGAEQGQATIALDATNHGDNRVVAGDAAPEDMAASEQITIQIAPVDDLVKGPIDFLKIDTQGSEWLAFQGAKELLASSPAMALLLEFWPYALRDCSDRQMLEFLFGQGFTIGKATDAPYPMTIDRILKQMQGRDPVKAGIDLYGSRNRPFHVLGLGARFKGLVRSLKEP
ncbi:MAG: FkbM family methyltransferase [Pseudohongiellaceae bacterium]|jgi:FkbM family methyltransferase